VGTAADQTGLRRPPQQVTCVGAAAPAADWGAYAADRGAVPARCADGSGRVGVRRRGAQRDAVRARLRAPRSLRSNLSWAGPVLGNRLSAQVEGTYSLNLDQPGFADLNFRPRRALHAPRRGRAAGVRAAVERGAGHGRHRVARRAPVAPCSRAWGEQRSDLRSESRQVRLGVSPTAFNANFNWSLSYVRTSVREQAPGFTSTAGDPLGARVGARRVRRRATSSSTRSATTSSTPCA
jgi:hypothetical protein